MPKYLLTSPDEVRKLKIAHKNVLKQFQTLVSETKSGKPLSIDYADFVEGMARYMTDLNLTCNAEYDEYLNTHKDFGSSQTLAGKIRKKENEIRRLHEESDVKKYLEKQDELNTELQKEKSKQNSATVKKLKKDIAGLKKNVNVKTFIRLSSELDKTEKQTKDRILGGIKKDIAGGSVADARLLAYMFLILHNKQDREELPKLDDSRSDDIDLLLTTYGANTNVTTPGP